jgi:hypothetical protein
MGRLLCRHAPPVLARPHWKVVAFERTCAYGSGTFKSVIREASLWPIGWQDVAANSSS